MQISLGYCAIIAFVVAFVDVFFVGLGVKVPCHLFLALKLDKYKTN